MLMMGHASRGQLRGSGEDRKLHEMLRPHHWAIEHLKLGILVMGKKEVQQGLSLHNFFQDVVSNSFHQSVGSD